MRCTRVDAGPGFTVIVCGSRQHQARCSVPNCGRPALKLCDFPVVRKGLQKTCDAKLCDVHTTAIGDDRDACPAHRARALAHAIPSSEP